MPAKTSRKILNLGGSGLVTIPADYRRYHKLDHGTKVQVIYDSFLLIVPPGYEEKLREREELIKRLLE